MSFVSCSSLRDKIIERGVFVSLNWNLFQFSLSLHCNCLFDSNNKRSLLPIESELEIGVRTQSSIKHQRLTQQLEKG